MKNIDDTRIALINNNIEYMKADIAEIKLDIKGLDNKYASQEQHLDLEKQVSALAITLQKSIEKQSGIQRFIAPVISSAFTAVLVFLVIFFLNNVKS